MDTTDVLVVGAGPSGLTAACSLLLQGVSVRVVDRADGPAPTSRANFLHARGAEVLDRVGALGTLPEDAISALTITVHLGGQPVSVVRFGDVGLRTSRPAMLVSQARVERELRTRFSALGGRVEWGSGLVDAVQDDNGVRAVLGDGREVHARWLVGCDGAHSTTRRLAGIDFPGVPVADTWLLADVRMDWPLKPNGSYGWMHRDGLVGALPMRDTGDGAGSGTGAGADSGVIWRLMAYAPGLGDEKIDAEEILERLRSILPERTGVTGARILGASWTSVFRIHRRLVDDYRHGRVLLVGDAAHIHSPMGGQGMLTGIGDAENLAWKLALVARSLATEALLDTYTAERRPLAVDVLRSTSTNARLQVGEGRVVRFVRENLMSPLLNLPAVQRWATAVASQLRVNYRRGPLAGGGRRLPARGPRPGDRIPDVECVGTDGTPTRLHAALGSQWVLLAAGHDPRTVELVGERLGGRLLALSPTTRGLRDTMLIRPDAHLAWRGDPAAGGLDQWLDAALTRGGTR